MFGLVVLTLAFHIGVPGRESCLSPAAVAPERWQGMAQAAKWEPRVECLLASCDHGYTGRASTERSGDTLFLAVFPS